MSSYTPQGAQQQQQHHPGGRTRVIMAAGAGTGVGAGAGNGDSGSDGAATAASHQPPPPVPPPLPPQRYGHRAATAIARLAQPFLYPSRSQSAHGHHRKPADSAHERSSRPGSSRFNSMQRDPSPNLSRSAVHKTGIPIAAIDISPDRTHAVLAGRDILKTVRVGDGSATEDVNLRASIVAYAAAHSSSRIAVSARHKDQLAANDVRWSNGLYDSIIATAAASGRIVIYDLNRPGLELNTLHEHARQVHRLAFNPFKGELLLSGSQDGSVKLWDLRVAPRDRRSQHTFHGHDQGVRDVKWSPTDGVEFAAGTDSGVVQRWDIRKRTAPITKLNAHEQKAVHSIDYHPGGKHLVSAGADEAVRVWDTTRSDRRQKAVWSLTAPQTVTNVCWRPGPGPRLEEDGEGPLAVGSSFVATSYSTDPRMHIWDFRRPSVPSQESDRYETPATALLWHSENLLWSVGNAGVFTQTDLSMLPKPLDRLNVNVLAVGPDNSMSFFSDQRSGRHTSLDEAREDFVRRSNTVGSSGEKFGSSLSANEASFEEGSFVSSALRKRRKKAATSRLLAGNPRNTDDAKFGQPETPLNLSASYETTQTGAHGSVGGIFDAATFKYLASHYEAPDSVHACNGLSAAAAKLEDVFMKNANHATRARDPGLAHTWRILAWAVRKELEDWQGLSQSALAKMQEAKKSGPAAQLEGEEMIRSPSAATDKTHAQRKAPPPALASLLHESGSNVPTPRVRPVTHSSNVPALPPGSLGDRSSEIEQVTQDGAVPPAAFPQTGTEPERGSEGGHEDVGTETPWLRKQSHATINTAISTSPKGIRENDGMPKDYVNDNDNVNSADAEASSSIPSFEEGLDEQFAARRAELSKFRLTPRPLLKLGAGVGGLDSGASLDVRSPSQPVPVPRPGLDRHPSGESFNLLSESMGSYNPSVQTSSFGYSPVKRGRDSFENRRSDSDHSLDERRSTADMRNAAMIEEQNRLLQEMIEGAETGSVKSDTRMSLDGVQQRDLRYARAEQRPGLLVASIVHQNGADEEHGGSSKSGEEADPQLNNQSRYQSGRLNSGTFECSVDLALASTKPWHASSFLPALLEHYLDRLGLVQLPVYLALYLYPFYPSLFPTALSQSHQIPVDANSPLTTSRLALLLLAYHGQLISLRQYLPAAQLRNLCAQAVPKVAAKFAPGTIKGYWCRTCKKPSKGRTKGRCTRCNSRWGGCMVCGQLKLTRQSPELPDTATRQDKDDTGKKAAGGVDDTRVNQASATVSEPTIGLSGGSGGSGGSGSGSNRIPTKRRSARWTYCQSCGHGGHASCVAAWFAPPSGSEGACAVPGCLHACAPGAWRDAVRAADAKHEAEIRQLRRGSGVLRDDRVARESRAVRAARGSDGNVVAAAGELGPIGVPMGPQAPPGVSTGPSAIPMESVRPDSVMLEAGGGMGLGLGMGMGMAGGRPRGRWRATGGGGGGGGGRTSIGSASGTGNSSGWTESSGDGASGGGGGGSGGGSGGGGGGGAASSPGRSTDASSSSYVGLRQLQPHSRPQPQPQQHQQPRRVRVVEPGGSLDDMTVASSLDDDASLVTADAELDDFAAESSSAPSVRAGMFR